MRRALNARVFSKLAGVGLMSDEDSYIRFHWNASGSIYRENRSKGKLTFSLSLSLSFSLSLMDTEIIFKLYIYICVSIFY